MNNREVSALEHYELLIDEGNDPCRDPENLKKYMERWDGENFFKSLKLDSDKKVLEVGIGTGRVADKVLKKGIKEFVGIDISTNTLKQARENLKDFTNVNLFREDICEYTQKEYFDIAYSVLTFMHIDDKEKAIQNMIYSLKPEGILVLSISIDNENYIDYGSRIVKIYPTDVESYKIYLERNGCEIISELENYDNIIWENGEKSDSYGDKIATILVAKKIHN